MLMSDYRFYTENMYVGPDDNKEEYFWEVAQEISDFERCFDYIIVDVEGKQFAMSKEHYNNFISNIDTLECANERLAYALGMPYNAVSSFLELDLNKFKEQVIKRSCFEKSVNSALNYYCMVSPKTFLSADKITFHNKLMPICSYIPDISDDIYRYKDTYYVISKANNYLAVKYEFDNNILIDNGIYIGLDKEQMYENMIKDAADSYKITAIKDEDKMEFAAKYLGINYNIRRGKTYDEITPEISKNKTII